MSPAERWKFFDPKETKESVSKVDSGPMVEVASAPVVRGLLAADTSGTKLTCLENVCLQAVEASGANVAGQQEEIDFMMLGASSVVKIVSAKLRPKQLKGMKGKATPAWSPSCSLESRCHDPAHCGYQFTVTWTGAVQVLSSAV